MVRITLQIGEDPRRTLINWGRGDFLRREFLLEDVMLSLEEELAQKSILLWARTRRLALTSRPTPRSTPGSKKDRLGVFPSFNFQCSVFELIQQRSLRMSNHLLTRDGDDRYDYFLNLFCVHVVDHIFVRDVDEYLSGVEQFPSWDNHKVHLNPCKERRFWTCRRNAWKNAPIRRFWRRLEAIHFAKTPDFLSILGRHHWRNRSNEEPIVVAVPVIGEIAEQ